MKKNKSFKKFKDFLKDESGEMTQDNILKIGLGALGSLTFMSMFAGEASAAHTNQWENYTTLERVSEGTEFDDYQTRPHSNHFDHASY